MFLFILSSIIISARSLLYHFSFSLFPLSVCIIYIKHRSVLEQCVLKYGIVSLTSCIPRIAVTLFLQFVFVITNNKYRIKCCSRNEIFYPILHHHLFKIRYNDPTKRNPMESDLMLSEPMKSVKRKS